MHKARTAIVIALVVGLALLHDSTAHAAHEPFRYKFPCDAQAPCELTQGPHGGAYDFVIHPPSGQVDDVRAVSEGSFGGYTIQASECTWDTNPNDPNAGIFALVDDVFGNTIIYAHLAAVGTLQLGQRVLQGDKIGPQGNTGRATGCAEHVHLGGTAGVVGYLDGVPESELVHVHPHLQFTSTNSVVGNFSFPGAAIRNKDYTLGTYLTSWGVVGFTVDETGTQAGCSAGSYCRLYVHAVPDPVVGHWGAEQTFRVHPDAGGFQDSSIQVFRWAINDAYWVKPPYFFVQRLASPAIGLPLMDQIGQFPGVCGLTCTAYQRFHLGYIWTSSLSGLHGVYCPDVTLDYIVSVSDIGAVTGWFGASDSAYGVYQEWPRALYDVNGDGIIAIADVGGVVAGFGVTCHP